MSSLDAGFYFIEDENVPMHVGSVLVFDGPVPSYGDVISLFVSRLDQVPRYRQKVRFLPLSSVCRSWAPTAPGVYTGWWYVMRVRMRAGSIAWV